MKNVYQTIHTQQISEGIRKTLENLSSKVQENIRRYPFLIRYARELRAAKIEINNNFQYWIDASISTLEKAGIPVFLAKDAKMARKIIGEIIETGKIVVKTKSMVSEEIHLREYLQKLGNEVWETDLGELIIQVAGQRPMHMVVPALHLSEKDVIEILKKIGIHGNNAEDCTLKVREFLREKFIKANFGISGCNAFSAESGSIFLIENEGNIRLSTSLPETYISIIGIDKILPEDDFALKSIMVQSAFFGTFPPSYINIIRQRHPKKMYVVFLDNGRKKSDEKLKEQLLCVRCGRCQLECPVFQITGSVWGGDTYGGPMGMGWSAITSSISEEVYLSCICGKCKEVCPMDIDIPNIILYLRKKYLLC
jgi:L-lactate dehydrogenase complex protein LldG